DLLLQLDELEHGHLSEALENAVYTSHGLALLLDCFSGSALAAQLFDPGLDEAIEVLHRRGDEPEEAGQRRHDRAEHLPAQDVDRRQRREALDLGCGKDSALHDAASNRKDPR